MTIDAVLNQIRQKIDNALANEVFEAVRDEEVSAIESRVYGVYSPSIYRRRGEYGGMADPYNIEMQGGSASDGKLIVINTTEPNPGGTISPATTGKYLPELIEYGNGNGGFYDFPFGRGAFLGPRPFTQSTIQALQGNKAHVSALRAGLQRQGVKVK